MKKLFIAMLSAVALMACNSTPKDYYEIAGKVTGVDDGVKILLFRQNGQSGTAIARDTLENGEFYFRVTPESTETEHLHILCLGEGFAMMSLDLYASAGDKVRIKGTDNLCYTWRVKGPAPEIKYSQAYVNVARDLYNEIQRTSIEQDRLRSLAQQPDADKAQLKAQYDSLESVNDQLLIKIHKKQIELMKRRKMNAIGLQRLNEMAMMCRYYSEVYPLREQVEEIYHSLDEEWLKHPTAENIRVSLFPPRQVTIGEPLIDGELYDLDGEPHSLTELRGEYILLDMWNRGCGPCIMALPEMGEIAEKYKGRLQVVSITTDNDSAWKEASKQHAMSWNNWSDGKGESGIYASYDMAAIPCYTLISPDGIVIDRWTGYGKGSLLSQIAEHIK